MVDLVNLNNIATLPPLVLGGATLKQEYNENPSQVPIVEILKYAFSKGMNAIDTSPYYGPSEEIFGTALNSISNEYPRKSYFICTKVGRIQLEDFDYSREHVRFSVKRSCNRLKTDYLDLVYLHDIEFVPMAQTLEALKELQLLKNEGIIKHFGLSGYPIDYMRKVSKHCFINEPEIGALDAILSYCNMNLQNKLLIDQVDGWKKDSNIKIINNGSILAMSLLRSQPTHSFHPCSQELRACADAAGRYCKQNGVDLADLASRYAISQWLNKGSTVIGVSTLDELKAAIKSYSTVAANSGVLSDSDTRLVEHIQAEIFGDHLNETWPSGIEHSEIM